MISSEMINQFSEIIKNKLNPIKIILFGSFALGNQNLNSDLDIMVILKESNLPRFKRGQNIRLELQRIFDIDIDLLIYTQAEINEWSGVELSFVNTVLKKGKILYER